jgi:hypothetical protein
VVDGNPQIWFSVLVKTTIEVPDELYRRVKAKSALEGRAIKDVTAELFLSYVEDETGGRERREVGEAGGQMTLPEREAAPSWFGVLRPYAQRVKDHDFRSIRESIARGVAAERGL